MNLGKKYKKLFEGKVRSNDKTLLKEAKSPAEAAYEMLAKAQGNEFKKIQDSINVEDGSVDGRDREVSGTIVIGGATFKWEMSTGDGMSSSYLGPDNDSVSDDDYILHDTLIDAVEEAGYGLDEEDEDGYSDDW